MRRIYLIIMMIVAAMVMSCNPKDDNTNNHFGDIIGGGGSWQATGVISGHDYVSLGLPSGLKWATCNIGASSPEDYGDYFAWGDISSKEEYTSINCPAYGFDVSELQSQGVLNEEGVLAASHDAATTNWGGSWRMPTKEEMQELKEHCKWEWMQLNGVYGSKVIGPNGKCIFIPATGYRHKSLLENDSYYGYYWSSSPNNYIINYAHYFTNCEGHEEMNYNHRYYGLAVRPVSI